MSIFVGKQRIKPTSSQYNRWLRALNPGYAKVDDRSFNQLLDFSVQFGSLINFFNLNDEVDGDWVDFFQSDPNMVLSSIDSIKISEIEQYFTQLQKKFEISPQAERTEAQRDGIELLTRLARRFDVWMVALNNNDKASSAAVVLRDNLRFLIENGLSDQLQKLQLHLHQYNINSGEIATNIAFPSFSHTWNLKQRLSATTDDIGLSNEDSNRLFDLMQVILNAFIDGLAELQDYVRFNTPAVESISCHRPQIGLYMAFVRIYHHAQESINTFSTRYARFYHDEVLRAQRLNASADRVYLNFTLEQEDEISSTSIEAKTLFNAGQDINGEDIVYTADKSLQVSAATLACLRMLNVEKGPLIKNDPAKSKENPIVVKRILASEVNLDDEGESSAPWPTFGGSPNDQPVVLGFAISSPYLLLTGGARSVQLQLQYSEAYYETILKPLLKTLSEETGRDESYIFLQVLLGAFKISASSAAEWFEIESYSIDFSSSSAQRTLEETTENIFLQRIFRICFALPASAPAIEPISTDASGSFIPTGQPMVNIYLSQQAIPLKADDGRDVEVYPISLLDKMLLNSATISTQVNGLNNLALQNTDGEIDPSSPFLVFGGTPVLGSYFQLSHRELFVKTPSSLGVTVEWFNLPRDDTGFSGYYRYYTIGPNGTREPNLFNNTTFLGEINIVNPGSWSIADSNVELASQSENVYLFRTKSASAGDCCPSPPTDNNALCSYTGFENLHVITPAYQHLKPNEFPPYYDPANSALRLTLSAPSYAFGNSLYPQNVLNAVIEDLPDTDDCKDKCLCDTRPIADAILCVESILKNCLTITDPNQRSQCIGAKLAEGELVLITALIQCLLRCLTGYENIVDAQTLTAIKDNCQDLLPQKSAMRLQNIKKILESVKALKKANGNLESESCGATCQSFFKVAVILFNTKQHVRQCADGENQADCERARLVSALEQIQAIYDASLTACMGACMAPTQELKYPNEPYLPQAISVHLDYQAACTVFDISRENAAESSSSFFHLLPFNGYRQLNCSSSLALPLLPNYVNNGNLYLGMSRLLSPQQLTLLFQLSGGCGLQLPAPQWSLLYDNHWRVLPPIDDLHDSTYGLQNSGIVALDIQQISNTNNTVLNSQYTWLRASVIDRSENFPLTQAIFPNALPASRVMKEQTIKSIPSDEEREDADIIEGNLSARADLVLPAHTISSAIEELPYIATVNQPMPSFGGRAPESYPEFEVRMGERLRHKDRAIQAWDYERLVLEQFPDVWKVQALNAHDALHRNAPGHVLVVVIAGPNCMDCSDPTTPNIPNDLLQSIQKSLKQKTSSFVQLHVCNPVYVRVQVKVSVSFNTEENSGANIERLNNDLVHYLSPWYDRASRSTRHGDYASEADIASFILNQSYVRSMESIAYLYEPLPESLESDWYFLTSALQHTIFISNHQTCLAEPDFSY